MKTASHKLFTFLFLLYTLLCISAPALLQTPAEFSAPFFITAFIVYVIIRVLPTQRADTIYGNLFRHYAAPVYRWRYTRLTAHNSIPPLP